MFARPASDIEYTTGQSSGPGQRKKRWLGVPDVPGRRSLVGGIELNRSVWSDGVCVSAVTRGISHDEMLFRLWP